MKTIKCGVSKSSPIKEVLILCRVHQSRRDEMFIEPWDPRDLEARRSEMSGQCGYIALLRSSRTFYGNMIYKHLAALRPGQDLLIEF